MYSAEQRIEGLASSLAVPLRPLAWLSRLGCRLDLDHRRVGRSRRGEGSDVDAWT